VVDYTWGQFSISSDPIIEVILVICFNSNLVLTHCRRDHFSLQKCGKICDGGIPQIPILGRDPTSKGHLDCQVLRAPQYLNRALAAAHDIMHSLSAFLPPFPPHSLFAFPGSNRPNFVFGFVFGRKSARKHRNTTEVSSTSNRSPSVIMACNPTWTSLPPQRYSLSAVVTCDFLIVE